MSFRTKQKGMSFLTLVLIFCVAGFFVLLGMKIGPLYLEHYAIREVVKSLEDEPSISRKPLGEIKTMLNRRLNINNINKLEKDNISIKRSGGLTEVEVKYDERRHIVANIDVIVSFSERVEFKAN